MKKSLINFLRILSLMGFNPITLVNFFRGLPRFIKNKSALKQQRGNNKEFPFASSYPVFENRFEDSGTMSGHYFHQDLLIAKKVFKNNPVRHVDIGSRTDGFVAHVAVFREIEVIDIRPQLSKVPNIVFKQMDLMQPSAGETAYCDSISCLHAIEHFGLGRYGDPIDYYGHIKAFENIHKLLKKDGTFYYSSPIGPQRIEFNAHRVFSVAYLLNVFKDKFTVTNFSYVNDKGDLFENALITPETAANSFNCNFGCGIFELKKN